MCRTYGTGSALYTRLCYRTGRAGSRVAGDQRGPSGHVLSGRKPKPTATQAQEIDHPQRKRCPYCPRYVESRTDCVDCDW